MDPCIVDDSLEIPTRCSFVIEFIIPKFIEGSTCFERHTTHHQELQTVFAASGLYTHVVTGRCQGWVGNSFPTQPWQRPVTTWEYKPEAANTVWSSWWWAVCRSKHVEPSINFGIINSITKLHFVGIPTEKSNHIYFSKLAHTLTLRLLMSYIYIWSAYFWCF